MFKILGGVLVGVFFGALLVEVLQKKKPNLVESVEGKARSLSDMLFGSIQKSYDVSEE